MQKVFAYPSHLQQVPDLPFPASIRMYCGSANPAIPFVAVCSSRKVLFADR